MSAKTKVSMKTKQDTHACMIGERRIVIYCERNISMEQSKLNRIIEKLIESHTTISTMESCTSGLIASMITDTEGASAIFPGGFVTYLNETKILIGVDEKIIREYGVYSKECAEAMAKTVQAKLGTDIAIGITGTTGNIDPNNADSVQGQAFFCIRMKDQTYSYVIREDVTGKSRHEIKQRYAERVFEALEGLIDHRVESVAGIAGA